MHDLRMSPLNAALIGFGFIAERGHLPAYLASMRQGGAISLSAIADRCEARRELARRLVPGVRVYADHRAMLAAESTSLDFVDIATPPCDHAAIALDALARGLHVLCEKPLTTTVDEARSLLAAARHHGRVVFPCHNYKHAPVVKAVRSILDTGRIGDVHLVSLNTFRHTHARGTPEWRPDWRRERAYSGGGIAMDHGSHTFYLAFDWLGAYPKAITAAMSVRGGWDTEDDLSCTIRFPGDRIATAHLTWAAGMRRVIYTIHGTRGAIRVEDDDVEIVTQDSGGFKTESARVASDWMDASHVGWFQSVLDQFRSAIARSDCAGSEAEDALRCVELIGAAYRSAGDGSREVYLPNADPVVPLRSRIIPSQLARSAATKR
jgi:predicted dehydrogenase